MIYLINHKKLEVKTEEEADADGKGPYILPSEGEKAVKEMRDNAKEIMVYLGMCSNCWEKTVSG